MSNAGKNRPNSALKSPLVKPRARWERKIEIGSAGLSSKTEVSHVSKADYMELTIDSGEGENVIPATWRLIPPSPSRRRQGSCIQLRMAT